MSIRHNRAITPLTSKNPKSISSNCCRVTTQSSGLGRRLTSRCSSVKITGSATNTRLDSLVIEADRMWEFTVRERLCLFRSPIPRSVAFSVLRNCPRCLYSTNTSFATPAMCKK
uniref:Uncharacterized protein n=1 Tax=Mola mola TaxID=94237 RepID=A0A3Q3XGE5_MOLML